MNEHILQRFRFFCNVRFTQHHSLVYSPIHVLLVIIWSILAGSMALRVLRRGGGGRGTKGSSGSVLETGRLLRVKRRSKGRTRRNPHQVVLCLTSFTYTHNFVYSFYIWIYVYLSNSEGYLFIFAKFLALNVKSEVSFIIFRYHQSSARRRPCPPSTTYLH